MRNHLPHNSHHRYSRAERAQMAVEVKKTFPERCLHQYIENDCHLSPFELQQLSQHRYSAVDTSWLGQSHPLQAFWGFVVSLYPLWLAPNLITLIGLLVNFATVLILSYYCPTATETAPAWAYVLSALGLFIYQTLDATDGKQARRTGSASPLGELFDHGCDSVSLIFVTLNVCYALKLGEIAGAVLFECIISVTMFYCAHWSTFCTGKLRFAKFDVTEAQLVVMAVLLVTALFGPSMWTYALFGIEIRLVFLAAAFLGSLSQLYSYFDMILFKGAGKNGSTLAGTSIITPIIPLLAVITPFMMIYNKSNTTFYDENIALYVFMLGAVASKATNRIIVGHMTRCEFATFDWIYIAPLLLMLNQYYDLPVPEKPLLIGCTIYAYASLLVYCTVITTQICSHMGIYCFRIKH